MTQLPYKPQDRSLFANLIRVCLLFANSFQRKFRFHCNSRRLLMIFEQKQIIWERSLVTSIVKNLKNYKKFYSHVSSEIFPKFYKKNRHIIYEFSPSIPLHFIFPNFHPSLAQLSIFSNRDFMAIYDSRLACDTFSYLL